jgi:integrase
MLYKRCGCERQEKCKHAYIYRFELNGVQYRKSTKTPNRILADKLETKRRAAILENRELPNLKPVRLAAHITAYCTHTKTANRTAYKDESVLDRFLEVVGDRQLLEITPFHFDRWKTERSKEVSRSTVNREMNILRGCFRMAVDWSHLAENPTKPVKDFRVDDQRIRVLTDDELRTVLAIPDPFVVLVCRATLESLARISELLNLRISHIGTGWVEMRKKGGKVSRVPVTPELRTALLARAAPSGYIFGEGAAGRPPTQQTASQRVFRALQTAGVLDASHHTMRHTGVTLMLEQGINPQTVKHLAGWSSMRMLERYGHARDAESVRATRSMSSYLDAVTKTVTSTEIPASGEPT